MRVPRAGRGSVSPIRTTIAPESSWIARSGGEPKRPASAVTTPATVTCRPTGSDRATAIDETDPGADEGVGPGVAVGVGAGVGVGGVGVGPTLGSGVAVGAGVGEADGSGVGVGVGLGVGGATTSSPG